MTNEEKLVKFAEAVKSVDFDKLLDHRDYALAQLDRLPAAMARKTYMYKALLIMEQEMVGRGL